MKVALVCDWLTNVGGAERVLLAIHEMYPDAPIYTSKYDPKGITWFKNADIRTGWLQIFPTSLRRFLGPARQLYFSHLDLTEYDLVISVTGAEAKAVKTKQKTGKNRTPEHKTEHICYCHVPTQYYWQMYDEYLKNPGFGVFNPLARLGLKLLITPLRKADYRSARRPDYFITISRYAANQIRKYYDREATVINPPVNVKKFSTGGKALSTIENNKNSKSQTKLEHDTEKRQGFITTSRQVTWKRIDLAIKACLMTKSELTIIGEGPEHERLEKLAHRSPLISFYPRMSQSDLETFLRRAKGYLFPSQEPFGIAPVEALAAGCPVIAYGEGGALDYVQPQKNGLLFTPQSAEALAEKIREFNQMSFSEKTVKDSAKPFDESIFKQKLEAYIHEKVQ